MVITIGTCLYNKEGNLDISISVEAFMLLSVIT